MKGWLQPPRLRIGEEVAEEHRHATWLELFYDLVFVVAVSQIAHYLNEDVSIKGFLGFVFLFIPIWWAWIGTTFYANRFDSDDIKHRLLTGLQMLAVAAVAVNIHDGLGKSSAGFAVAYAVTRLALILEYLRVIKHIPQARGLAKYYSVGFSVGAVLWLVSAFVPIPIRFVVWGLALAIDFSTGMTAKRFQVALLPHPEHLPERFGLFTIIVLGEAIIAVVNGVSEQEWDLQSAISAMFGFCIAFSLWWIYFENVSGSILRSADVSKKVGLIQIWLYGHLPLVIGLATTGVGVEQIIMSNANQALSTPQRWLICGGVGLCLISLSILHNTGMIFRCKVRAKYRLAGAGILILLALVGTRLHPVLIIGLVALVCAFQVIEDLFQSGQLSVLKD